MMDESRLPLPNSYEALYAQAQHESSIGHLEHAVPLYRRLVDRLVQLSDRVLDRRPLLRDVHRAARVELAAILRLEGRFAEAIEVEEVLLTTHPQEAGRWRQDLAAMRVAKGEVERGLAELQGLADEAPDDAARWLVLGQEARIEGRFDLSRRALDRALDVCERTACQDLARIHDQRFRLFKATGQLDDALAAWELAARDEKLGQNIDEIYTMLAGAGRYSEALRYVNRDPNSLRAGFQRGLIASFTGNPGEARQEWRRVAEMNPDEFQVGHEAWVESVLRLRDQRRALEWLQDALREHFSARLLILSGIGWAMERDREVAANLFQQAINLLRYQRPPKKKLDSSDWRLLDSLVADEEMKKALRSYFAVVETLWQ